MLASTRERGASLPGLRTTLGSLTLAALAACGTPGSSGGSPAADADATESDTATVAADTFTSTCGPDESVCLNATTRLICDHAGHAAEVPCGDGEGCQDGACLPQVCVPGASTGVCSSTMTHEQCNAGGTGWLLVTCQEGTSCRSGICAGPICTPGTRICAGFTIINECDAEGSGWTQVQTCPQGSACADGACLSPCEVNLKDGSYLGCEYWAVDLDNVQEAADQVVGLVVSVPADGARTEARITNTATGVLLDAATLGVPDLFVEPGEVEIFRLPTGYDIDGTTLTTNTFHLVTTSPVTVHQFNPLNGDAVYSNDASLLLPSQVVGNDYVVMSWPHRKDNVATLRGFATIIATMPGTTEIQVTPSATVAGGPGVATIAAGTTRIFQLAQGQAINLETEGGDSGDLTGTLVHANRQATVIAGHECANVPVGISACDHIESQLFSVDTWGNRYIADAFSPRSDTQIDIWRVMGGDNGVTVTTSPPVPGYERFVLQRGTWVQFASGSSFELSADGPILVGHYLTGSGYPGAEKVCSDNGFGAEAALGDPAFTLPAPTNRFLKRYAVLTPSGYEEDYLNVVARTGAQIQVDGQPLAAALVPVGDSGWAVARQRVSPGVHQVTGSSEFGLTAYGYDCDVSYAYPGGLRLEAYQEFSP
ncbi:MAG: hypothetical protein EP329_23150 [Deltaproteobacteria bacterium]|nr:MAG: hypothetical protein EP329_23150 [Deltaproteobacteria bacterium]